MANILIVDDQSCVRDLITEELVGEGYAVRGVGDVASAVDEIRSRWADVVLLDLYLDGPQGFDLLADVKRESPDLPVIVVTAYDSYGQDDRLSQADGYIVKRFGFWDDLKQAIRMSLSEQTFLEAGSRTNAFSKLACFNPGKILCQNT